MKLISAIKFNKLIFWLTGPIFTNELRVTARRRRYYIMRVLYALTLIALISFMAYTKGWFGDTDQISDTSQISREIVFVIANTQFIVFQLLAVLMLSTSVSEEIYKKTLGVLMTTPITGLQIVMGKLLSRLWIIFLLVGISVPMVSIMRLWGGLPWKYVVTSFMLTTFSVIFAGSISLFFSIKSKHSFAVILRSVFVLLVLYLILPFSIWGFMMEYNIYRWDEALQLLGLINPFIAAANELTITMSASATFFQKYLWMFNCIIMLSASILILKLSIKSVRKVALKQACGENVYTSFLDRFQKSSRNIISPTDKIRRVKGHVIAWKEMQVPIIEGGKKIKAFAVIITIGGLVSIYHASIKANSLRDSFDQTAYVMLGVIIGFLFTMVLSSTLITREKESRTWEVLLGTPLSDWEILFGKIAGSIRRTLLIWTGLIFHMIIFTILGYIHPIGIILLLMAILPAGIALTGIGIYFSTRLKRSTTAMTSSIAFSFGLWFVLPILINMLLALIDEQLIQISYHFSKFLTNLLACFNPLVEVSTLMLGVGGITNATDTLESLRFSISFIYNKINLSTMIQLISISMILNTAIGLLFIYLAKKRIRKEIFT